MQYQTLKLDRILVTQRRLLERIERVCRCKMFTYNFVNYPLCAVFNADTRNFPHEVI